MFATHIQAEGGPSLARPTARARGVLRATLTAALGVCLLASPEFSSASQSPQKKFEHAELMRQELEGMPQSIRSRKEYGRVMDAYRAVYHGDPGNPKADASIAAVAELLAEEGRLFSDRKPLEDAVGQYEFLRKQYPESSLRPKALLIEAEILAKDLDDRTEADTKLREFLKSYPRSDFAPQARRQLAALERTAKPTPHRLVMPDEPKAALHVPATTPPVKADTRSTHASAEPAASTQDDADAVDTTPQPRTNSPARAVYGSGREPRPAVLTEISQSQTPPPQHGSRAIMVTDIRHWSTPTSTRIAIDLEDEVHFLAGRVLNPDRIYFDLYHARLVPQLIGHMIPVQNDAFLRNIRASQYTPDITRIVLDVGPVAEYTAFLLPNPYRLVIDVHARKSSEPAPSTPAAGGALTLHTRPNTDTYSEPPANQPAPAAAPTIVGPAQPATNPPVASSPPVKPKPANPDDETIDANGHETGVAHPPSDVSTTPSDEDLPPPATPQKPPPSNTPQSQNISKPRSARPKPSPQKSPASQNEIADVDQPQVVHATRKPTTQPIVAEVTAPSDDATDTPPFAKSVLPGAAPQSVAATPQKSKPAKKTKHATATATPDAQILEVHEAEPTATGERSLVRALGLKIGRIVIDPGHGGHDAGTVGPDGLEEKDVVLDVGLRLGKLLQQRLGADVTYTRSTDVFIPLETRTAIANKAQADLFVSIHANSSKDDSARGVETYYLNFTSSPDALDVAARENAVSEKSIHELQDLVKKITLKDKIDESREFAADVEHSLYTGVSQDSALNENMKDRGVKKAPFVVLIGANMPSILTEISFVSNPDDARQLREAAYRQRIAEALYTGIAKYINGLSSMRLAQNPVHHTIN
jgi:N-acetylmuramoyl-L-alanine amidase